MEEQRRGQGAEGPAGEHGVVERVGGTQVEERPQQSLGAEARRLPFEEHRRIRPAVQQVLGDRLPREAARKLP